MISKTVEGYEFEEFIYCDCGCGKTRPILKYGNGVINKSVKYIVGHMWNGRKHSEETRQKISKTEKGKKLSEETKLKISKSRLKDKIGYAALHYRIRKQKPKPKLCEICKLVPPYDLANISGKYLFDLSDWLDLCRKCHKSFDKNKMIIKCNINSE